MCVCVCGWQLLIYAIASHTHICTYPQSLTLPFSLNSMHVLKVTCMLCHLFCHCRNWKKQPLEPCTYSEKLYFYFACHTSTILACSYFIGVCAQACSLRTTVKLQYPTVAFKTYLASVYWGQPMCVVIYITVMSHEYNYVPHYVGVKK